MGLSLDRNRRGKPSRWSRQYSLLVSGLWHGWERLINPNIHNKMIYDKTHGRHDGIRCLRNVNYTESKYEKEKISTIDVHTFTTNESLNSPFVKGAKMADARYYKTFKDKHLYRRQKKSRFFNFGRPSNRWYFLAFRNSLDNCGIFRWHSSHSG